MPRCLQDLDKLSNVKAILMALKNLAIKIVQFKEVCCNMTMTKFKRKLENSICGIFNNYSMSARWI